MIEILFRRAGVVVSAALLLATFSSGVHAAPVPLASCSIEGDMRTGVLWDDEQRQLQLLVLEGDEEVEVVRIPSVLPVVEVTSADGVERNFMFQTSGPTRYRLRLVRSDSDKSVTAQLFTRMGDGDWNTEGCHNADLSAELPAVMPEPLTNWLTFVRLSGAGWGQ